MTSDPCLHPSVRAKFPGAEASTYLNASAVGLTPQKGVEAVRRAYEAFGQGSHVVFPTMMPGVSGAREKLASLLGVPQQDVGLAASTSDGMDVAATLLQADGRRQVVMARAEFPASSAPFRARGYQVDLVDPVDGLHGPEAYADSISDETVAIVASAVQFANGEALDVHALGNLARERGVFLVLNLTQAAGIIPLDLPATGAHLAVGGGLKWLCSGVGSGYWWCPKELIERFGIPRGGWLSHADPFAMTAEQTEFRQEASVIEGGTGSMVPYLAMNKFLTILGKIGVENVLAHVQALNDLAIRWADDRGIELLSPREGSRRGGQILLAHPGPEQAQQALAEQGVIVSARGRGIRISPHLYNSAEDIGRLLEAW
jgi:selenocysteine lyase/cysteine desulfurase